MGFYPNALAGGFLTSSLVPGAYIQPEQNLNTSALLVNGELRLIGMYSPLPFHISAMGAEFTAAGDANSLCALAGYTDSGFGFPAALLANPGSISTGTGDAGTIPTGGTPGVYMIPLASPIAVPAGMSWWGGVVQGVTVTQPTMRTAEWSNAFSAASSVVPAPGISVSGYAITGVSGALPSSFGPWPGNAQVGAIPRVVMLISSVP
jgi:hypothetical protein